MLEELSNEASSHMDKAIEHLHHELATIRTGKANPALLDSIQVEYFGQKVPLKQVANVAVPDPRLITVQPWDKTVVPEIEKAIMASELGLNPQSDGTLIRLPVPPLTEERRKDLVKVVRRMGEEAKVALRNIRRHANDELRKLEKSHEISEDNMHTKQDEIQKLTDDHVKNVDKTVEVKEKEIMEI
jgi:ribosome recycling factor